MIEDSGHRRLRVGLFLFGSVILMITAVLMLGRSRSLFARRAKLHTSFVNTSGLVVGAPVRLAGVDIGIVDGIRFDADPRQKQVRVSLSVDRRYLPRIRQDSLARLSSKGLLGDMMINITVGDADSPPVVSGGSLKAAENDGLTEIVASLQEGITQIRSLAVTVEKGVREVFTPGFATDVHRIGHAAAGVAENIEHGQGLAHAIIYDPKLAASTNRLVANTSNAVASADDVIQRVEGLLAAVQTGDGTLHSLVYKDDGGKLLTELRGTVHSINAVIGEVQHGNGMLHTLIYQDDNGNLIANLNRLSKILRDIGDEVQQGKGTIGGLLKDPSVYEDLKTILGNVKRNKLLKTLVRYTIKKDLSEPR